METEQLGISTELGHRMTKEDKSKEQLDRSSGKEAGEGPMYTNLGERRNACWRNIFNH